MAFAFRVRLGITYHHIKIFLLGSLFKATRHLRIKRVGNVGDYQAYRTRQTCIQTTGNQIRLIVHFASHFVHFRLHGLANSTFRSFASKHPRHRGLRDFQGFGYIF